MSDVDLYVARQPIFDANLNVHAYELLYRSAAEGGFNGADANQATARVISAAFYTAHGAGILGGKPAFINFPQRMLEEDDAQILPPRSTVIEVLEDVEATEALRRACRRLRAAGFRVALDDVTDGRARHPLADAADIVKVDFRGTGRDGWSAIASLYQPSLQLLAEKVETQEEYRAALSLGYTLFQGYSSPSLRPPPRATSRSRSSPTCAFSARCTGPTRIWGR
jgi:EAL and modified HD-GYP domain-containing signal transduction protein